MKIDSVIFDMDGVLVDVTYSYRVAIEKTTNFFLQKKGLSSRATPKDVAKIKNLPGFNNDWDATYALITFLAKGIKKERFAQSVEILKPINKQSMAYKEVQDVFQTFYRELIPAEKCLISKRLLKVLKNMKLKLGIATGRPREEALLAINNFRLQTFFPEYYIVALEDTVKEKPAPDPLLEVKKRMQAEEPIYVGDTINDVIAAKAANMPCIFVGKEKLGDIQINDVNSLLEVLL